MWQCYGGNYEKVAVEFEFVNDSASWHNFMLSPIFYHPPEQLISFIHEVDEIITKFDNLFYMDMSRIIGFHKRATFNHENELRLATYFPIKDFQLYGDHIYPDSRLKACRNRIAYYIKLPLWVDSSKMKNKACYSFAGKYSNDENEFFEDKPKIKISNVYFGEKCGLSENELTRFIGEIERTVRNVHGYRIDLSNNRIEKK